ncbi:MAG: helix-turn-helix domain-containing protein [Actinobacteria bacterium]|nr:helix-turn-helix domain-containing protein [Actinomycetota bacterium]
MNVRNLATLDSLSSESVRALTNHLHAHSSLLAERMVETITAEVPFYSHLPREQLDGDILAICEHNIHTFSEMLTTGAGPSESALEWIGVSAARRAEEQVPLDAVLSAYHVGLIMLWEHCRREWSNAGLREPLSVATVAMEYIAKTMTTVSCAYLETHEIVHGAERDMRRALVTALLAGEDAKPHASQAGVYLSAEYLVVAMEIGHSLDEECPEVERTVAARRKIRRVDAAARDVLGTDALTLLDVAGGVILIPTDPDHAEALAKSVPALISSLADAARSPITAGYAWHPEATGVMESGTEAKALATLAVQLGLPPGAYRLADLALEYALSRDRSAMAALADTLRPLEEHGTDLIETLDAYFSTQLDRRLSAELLHIHPNTLDYRLRRIRALTGLDANSSSGITALKAGLLVNRIGRSDPGSF